MLTRSGLDSRASVPEAPRVRKILFLELIVVVTLSAGCVRYLDMKNAEAIIKTGLNEQLGLAFSSVTCPETREMKTGDVFECKAVAETGGDLTVQVTQSDDQGKVNWKLVNGEKVLSLTAVEEQVKDGIAKQLKVDASIDCGGKRRVSVPGQTFECTATAGAESRKVVVTMDDAQGNVTWTLK